MTAEFLQKFRIRSRREMISDLTAGFIVATVALPLTIAFAIASGVSPEKGVLTAVIAGALISLFSGSPVQIGGPSGPFVIIAFGIVQQFGLDGLMVATFTAGLILVVMARAKLGSLIKFIPFPVTAGFTSGVAISLVTTEVKDLFGLEIAQLPASMVDKWIAFGGVLDTVNPYAAAIAAGTILIHMLQPKLLRRVPGTLVALILSTAAVSYFDLPVETVGSRFGSIPSSFPSLQFPHLSFELVQSMFNPATAIALLVAIEALLSAVVADGMLGTQHEPNRVLAAQGIANIGSALFGCLPATAAIARTATNVRNGARTPLAGLTHSLVLLLVVLFFGKWSALVPLSCLAAILVTVAYHLLDWHSYAAIFRAPRGAIAVFGTTLGLTVIVDLTTGIEIGMILAAALFIRRMATETNVHVVTRELAREAAPGTRATPAAALPRGVEVYEVNGPLFFGAVYKLREAMHVVARKPRVRIVRMEKVNAMDSTGLHALEEIHTICRKEGSAFLISEIHAQPFVVLMKSGLLETFGKENVLASYDDTMKRVEEILSSRAESKSDRS